MMIIKTIVLGIVQGLTEFLPISSSGHLALLETIFKIEEPVALAAFLHFGTLLATIVYFRKEIFFILKGLFSGDRNSVHYIINIIIGSIPIIIFAFLFRNFIESMFSQPKVIAIFLGLTGTLLLLTGSYKKGKASISKIKALIIGIGQMLAVFPGISRSGTTISAGLLLKVSPNTAFQFSFLLSLPAVFGANLFELITLDQALDPISIIVGMTLSFFSGLLALFMLRRLVVRRFHFFGIYCLIISIILLLL